MVNFDCYEFDTKELIAKISTHWLLKTTRSSSMCLVRLLMFRHAILKPRPLGTIIGCWLSETSLWDEAKFASTTDDEYTVHQLVKWFTKLLAKIAIPFLLRCSLWPLTHDRSMFWCWTRPQPFWLQNDLMILLHSVTFLPRDSSSKRCVNAEIVTLVLGEDEETRFPRSTSFSATVRGEESLTSLVPACRIISRGSSWRDGCK